jgi:excisionase family DNA binding protein
MKFRNQKLRYSVSEFCEITGLSRSKAYERIKAGQIAIVKDGNETFITHDEAVRYSGTTLPPAFTGDSAA